jgi:type I restriction enzyme S subunit
MKKYDTYKDSGIEWIGEIPSHWDTKRIRHIADIFGRIGYRGYTVEDIVFDESGAVSLSPSNIENQKLTLESVTRITQEKYEESPEIMVYENDVVLVKTASVGKAAIIRPLNDLATINPQLVVFKNYRIDKAFFYYEIISRIIQDQITQDLNGGVVNTITQTNLNNYSIIVPPPEEQTAIANYLDRKTAEIDELIADKKRLLELYEEEKTAIIKQAVTKGINPEAPMKDSGIEWLGDVPAHWEVKRVKDVLESVIGGGTPSTSNPLYWDGNIPWVSAKDMKVEHLFSSQDHITELAVKESSTNYIEDERVIVVVRSGILKHTFPVALNKVPISINQDLKALKPKSYIFIEFLFWKLKGQSKDILTYCNKMGATVDSIEMQYLMDFPFPFPPLEEQRLIVHHIKTECALIDAKKTRTEKLIELLTEYRTALISEVVTGRVKVIE